MGNATTVPDATMGRREFMAWMVAAVAAMVAGSRVWRLFRQATEAEPEVVWASIRSAGLVTNQIGQITAIDQAAGTITVAWSGPALDPMAYAVAPTDSHRYISSLFRVGESVAIPMPA